MSNRVDKGVSSAVYGLDMLRAHCATLNNYNWVKASGKQYVIAKDDSDRHYLDLRMVKDFDDAR